MLSESNRSKHKWLCALTCLSQVRKHYIMILKSLNLQEWFWSFWQDGAGFTAWFSLSSCVFNVRFLWMKSHPPEMCIAICLFKDIVISQVRVNLWWGGSTWHRLLTIAFWPDTISVRKICILSPHNPPPQSRGTETVCVAPQRRRLWHCGCGLMKSRLAGCQSVGWALLSWWRSLDTQSRWNTHKMWDTLLS